MKSLVVHRHISDTIFGDSAMFWDGTAMYSWECSDILKECSDKLVGAIIC